MAKEAHNNRRVKTRPFSVFVPPVGAENRGSHEALDDIAPLLAPSSANQQWNWKGTSYPPVKLKCVSEKRVRELAALVRGPRQRPLGPKIDGPCLRRFDIST